MATDDRRPRVASALALLLTASLVVAAALRDRPTGAPPIASTAPGEGPDVVDGDVDVDAPTNGAATLLARFAALEAELREEAAQDDPEDTEAAYERTARFADAVGSTADEVLADPEATPTQRREAAEAKLDALVRLAQVAPEVHDDIVAAADALDRDERNADLGPVTAFYRVRGLALDIAPEVLRQLSPSRFDALADATVRLARAEPVHPRAADTLYQVADEADRRGVAWRARALFALFVERFGASPAAAFAEGRIRRIAQRGEVVEDLSGPSPGGATVRLDDFRGRVVLVDVWATWSGPCDAERPALAAARRDLAPLGFEIFGVSLDDDPARVEAYDRERGVDWPQIVAGAGAGSPWSSPPALRFGITELPFKMVIGRDGRLLAVGNALGEVLPAIEDALAGLAPTPTPPPPAAAATPAPPASAPAAPG